MSILSSTKSGKAFFTAEIEEWIKKELNISEYDYELRWISDNGKPYYAIDVHNRDVNLNDYPDEQLPDYIQFGDIVAGNFLCAYSKKDRKKRGQSPGNGQIAP